MNHDKDRDIRVEQGIYLRSGNYSVKVWINGKQFRSTFKTIEEARAWREDKYATREAKPLRRRVEGGISAVRESCWGAPEDIRKDREGRRELIASSPRSKRVIDGRTFTVIHLPPGGIAA